MSYLDRLNQTKAEIIQSIEGSSATEQVRPEILKQLAHLKISLEEDGPSSSGLTAAEMEAAVRDAIESAENLTAIETALQSIAATLGKQVFENQEIQNLVLSSANQQFTFVVPSGTKRLSFKCRYCVELGDVQGDLIYSWIPNRVIDSGTGLPSVLGGFDILPWRSEETDQSFFETSRNLYLASSTEGVVVSLRRWF